MPSAVRLAVAAFALAVGGASGCSSSAPSDHVETDSGETSDATRPGDASLDGAGAGDAGSDVTGHDGTTTDASDDGVAMTTDSGDDADSGNGCFLTTTGVFGECMDVTACMAMTGYISTPGFCPGASSVECCTDAPDVADNPPTPTGWMLMQQSAVTPAMTTWAVMILDAPTMYPMWSTTTQFFGTLDVLARVEWHPPDFQNSAIHRGVTLYQM